MEDDDAVGLLERGTQIGVDVDGVVPSLTRAEEGGHHVGLHRARTKQRDVSDEVTERLGRELPDELALAR